MSETLPLLVPAALVERIAQRVAELLRDQAAPAAEPLSPWLDIAGACAYLGFSRDRLYKLTAAGAIPCRKKRGGQGLLFHRAELDAWIETAYERLDHRS
jgi:excisionase family DNA binding protein